MATTRTKSKIGTRVRLVYTPVLRDTPRPGTEGVIVDVIGKELYVVWDEGYLTLIRGRDWFEFLEES